VLWAPPVQARAWFKRPALKVKEEIAVSNPQYLNKDAGDRYLFLPAGTGKTAPAYLYDIPRRPAQHPRPHGALFDPGREAHDRQSV